MTSNKPLASAVRDSLRELPELSDAGRGRIVKHLVAAGHVHDDLAGDHLYAAADGRVKLSPIAAAADARNSPLLGEVKARCERLGFQLDLTSDKPVSVFAMDEKFKGADISERLRIKTAMKSLHLI